MSRRRSLRRALGASSRARELAIPISKLAGASASKHGAAAASLPRNSPRRTASRPPRSRAGRRNCAMALRRAQPPQRSSPCSARTQHQSASLSSKWRALAFASPCAHSAARGTTPTHGALTTQKAHTAISRAGSPDTADELLEMRTRRPAIARARRVARWSRDVVAASAQPRTAVGGR